jgi:maleylpyruvate isomerase
VRLYTYWRSSSAWRVRIALAWKGVPFESVPVNLLPGKDEQRQPSFRAKNPLGQVPVLELDARPDDAGEPRRISQSLAILEYLEEAYPQPPLLPPDPWLRARARQLAHVVASGIQPLQNVAVLQAVKTLGGDEQAWARTAIAGGLAALEAEAARPQAGGSGRFLIGDAPSFADVCLVPQLYNARRFGVDVTPFPTLLRVESTCSTLPAFAGAIPELQPDAPSS